MLFLIEHLLPDIRHGCVFHKREYGANDVRQSHIELILCQFLQHLGTQDIARDIIFVVFIHGDARIGEFAVGIYLLQCFALGSRLHHQIGGHNLLCPDVDQLDEVLNYLVLLGLKHALLGSHRHHGRHLFPAHRHLLCLGREDAGDEF